MAASEMRDHAPIEIATAPLTPERWSDFADLFGPRGACYDCWCLHFRLPPKLRQSLSGPEKRDLMRRRVEEGPPPGILAYGGDEAIGWMQIGPRADVPEWNNKGRVSAPLDDAPMGDRAVWAVSCFFARSSARGKGISHVLLASGIDFARANGARVLEACPMDRAKQSKSIGLFVGSTRVFEVAGFEKLAVRKEGRPLMRLEL
ncbi:GNAT family N-acetyltransferase [Paramesorhizobium deserti]|nr:GNAT family N-acetyltransferase [Paramesorhizobium deserti]